MKVVLDFKQVNIIATVRSAPHRNEGILARRQACQFRHALQRMAARSTRRTDYDEVSPATSEPFQGIALQNHEAGKDVCEHQRTGRHVFLPPWLVVRQCVSE